MYAKITFEYEKREEIDNQREDFYVVACHLISSVFIRG
jgi:hypothetical protein